MDTLYRRAAAFVLHPVVHGMMVVLIFHVTDTYATDQSRTILLVDDRAVLYRSGTERVLNRPERCPANPVLKPTKPWEVAIGWTSIIRNPQSGRYQLWYQAFAGNRAQQRSRRCVVCYAESDDGTDFTKPSLGQFDFNGIQETNIVLVANGGASDRYGCAVVFDPRDPDPALRYKMAYNDFARIDGKERPGLCVAFSPDGIHWKKHPVAPVQSTSYGDHGVPVPFVDRTDRPWDLPLTMADAVDIFFDSRRKAFVFYGKMWIDGPDGGMYFKHGMGRTESQDFINWTRPQLVSTPNDLDPPHVEFHTSPTFLYHDYYFCLNQILDRGTAGGVIDIELMLSHDGLRWQRPFQKPFFISREKGNAFDSGSIFTNSTPVVLQDEIRFYYGAYSQGATGADDHTHISGVGFVSIQRDRFAGIRTRKRTTGGTLRHDFQHVGQVTLKPVDVSSFRSMTINAEATDGTVRVEVLRDDGRRIHGFSLQDAIEIQGDSLRHVVRWKNHQFHDLPADRYLFRLHLKKATVFSVTMMAH